MVPFTKSEISDPNLSTFINVYKSITSDHTRKHSSVKKTFYTVITFGCVCVCVTHTGLACSAHRYFMLLLPHDDKQHFGVLNAARSAFVQRFRASQRSVRVRVHSPWWRASGEQAGETRHTQQWVAVSLLSLMEMKNEVDDCAVFQTSLERGVWVGC